jgi:predicted CXXCH cytochrome family protein
MNELSLYRWKVAGLIASAIITLSVPVYVIKESYLRRSRPLVDTSEATFVGRTDCIECHQAAYEAWLGSDHDLSMDVASDSTVLGNFDDIRFSSNGVIARFYKKNGRFYVNTQGPDGIPAEFEITYVFGVEPLQQYLIPFPGGRLQSLTIAWDTIRREWFYLYPGQDIPYDDWLHWTRPAQNWNGMCAECHSTNLIKNYDAETKTFNTTWSEIDVSCEACHGPGSRHVQWAELPPMARPKVDNYGLLIRTGDITSREQVELCAPCHSRRTELGDYDHSSSHLLDNVVPSVLEDRLYHADGQIDDEVYVYGSFVQSKMYNNNIKCSDCHDVHSLKLKANGNELCLKCHQSEAYDVYEHHFHKKVHKNKPSDGHLCVKCHMPERPYMVIDYRADHSIRVPRPDLSDSINTPNACNQPGCHDDKSVAWSVENYRDWYGRASKPHYGNIIAAGREGRPEARDLLIRLAGDQLNPAIVRATALSLLVAYPGKETDTAFNNALADEEALVRYTAIMNLNPPSAERLIEQAASLLFDPVLGVRTQAAAQLAGVPDRLLKPYQQQALEQALSEYVNAMTYSLDFAFAGHNLGNLYTKLNEPEKAAAYYEDAIEIDDLFYPAKVNLAMLYNSQGNNKEAEGLLREVLEAYPDQHEVAYSLALLLVELKTFNEAVIFLQRAADGMPNRSRVYYNLGLLRQQLGQAPEAEAALIHAVDLESDNLDYLYALADFYIKRGFLRKALPIADRMIAADPNNPAGRDIKLYIEGQLDR